MPPRATKQRKLLGEAIRSERLARHWTQEQFAEKTDLSINFVGNVERGEQGVSLDSLAQIAAILKVTIAHLMTKAGI